MENFTKTLKSFSIIFFVSMICIQLNAQNNALNFNNTNDSVQIPNSPFVQQIASVQLSVNITSNTGSDQGILSCGGLVSGVFKGFAIYAGADGKWHLKYGDGGTNTGDVNLGSITYGSWHNLAGTYNPNNGLLLFYIDGAQTGSTNIVMGPNTSFPIVLGQSNSNNFKGELDELSFWSGVLTPAVVSYNAQHGLAGNEGGLLAYYNFNEGSANQDNTTPPINILKNNRTDSTSSGILSSSFTLNGNTSNWVSSNVQLLPLDLIGFTGSNKNGQNNLQWSTATEQNTSHFDIQRSTNGVNFSNIGKVAAAGNSSNTKNYSYSDGDLSSLVSVYYYRLNMVDIDGASKYSPVVAVKNSNNAVSLKVFPNPTTDRFTITLQDNKLLNTKVSVSDLNGRVLQRISLNQSETRVNISNYVKGVYVLKFEDGNSIKVIKE